MRDIQNGTSGDGLDGTDTSGHGGPRNVRPGRSTLFGLALLAGLGIKVSLLATGIFLGYYAIVVVGLGVLAGGLIWYAVVRSG